MPKPLPSKPLATPFPGCLPVCSESPCLSQKMGTYASVGDLGSQPQHIQNGVFDIIDGPTLSRESAVSDDMLLRTVQKMFGDIHSTCVSWQSQGQRMEENLQIQLASLETKLEKLLNGSSVVPEQIAHEFDHLEGDADAIVASNFFDTDQSMRKISTEKKEKKEREVITDETRIAEVVSSPKLTAQCSALSAEPKQIAEDHKPWKFPRSRCRRLTNRQQQEQLAATTSSVKTTKQFKRDPDIPELIVMNPKFDGICALAVLLNSLLVGLLINHEAISNHKAPIFTTLEYVFTAFFTIELAIRLAGRKWKFFMKGERHWAVFDILLVLLSYIDITMEAAFESSGGIPGPGASMGKILKMARMARILRILRMVRFLTKIRLMVTLIVGSMVSLFWLLVLLITVMYIFAIVLTQGATMWLKPGDGYDTPTQDSKFDDVKRYYGSVPRTIYTLFMAMTGGVSWGEPADVSQAYGWVYYMIFIYFIFFTIFSVMNIVTGVFVDGAIQQAESDRSVMVQKQMALKKELRDALEDVLAQLDQDGDGCLSREEWDEVFLDKSVIATLSGLQVDVEEAEDLWDMLDVDGDGTVDISEFVDGMLRLKGNARAIDVERLLGKVNKVIVQLHIMAQRFGIPSKKSSRRSHVVSIADASEQWSPRNNGSSKKLST